MNSPAAIVGKNAATAASAVSRMGFPITEQAIRRTASDVEETTLISRSGGVPTLAVAIANIASRILGGRAMEAF
jgi:carbon starvation protein